MVGQGCLSSITDLFGMPNNPEFTLNIALFVCHRIFLHPKTGNLQEVSRVSVHIYTKLQLWQLTYFFFLDKNDTARTPQRLDRVLEHPVPYTPIGFYADDDYRRIIPVPRPIWKILKGYVGLFEDVEDRSSYLFPVIRKNNNIAYEIGLSVKDAHKILRRLQSRAKTNIHFDWNKLRQIAVARMLRQRQSIQQIQYNTGYLDPKSIKNIAGKYQYGVISTPSFQPRRFVGLDFPGTALRENAYWYPPELYEFPELK